MYRKIIWLVGISLVLCGSISQFAWAQSQDELESAYKNFYSACASGNIAAIENTMTSNSFNQTRNATVSAKLVFDGAMFKDTVEFLPKLDDQEFVKVLSKGDTAALTTGMNLDDTSGAEPPREYTVFRFARESGVWKFDTLSTQYGNEKINDAEIMKKYKIDGTLKVAPEMIMEPDYAGFMNIKSFGYRVSVIINGIKQSIVEDTSASHLINGGLKSGINDIEVYCEKVVETTSFTPEFKVLVNKEGKSEEVFTFAPTGEIKALYKNAFVVEE